MPFLKFHIRFLCLFIFYVSWSAFAYHQMETLSESNIFCYKVFAWVAVFVLPLNAAVNPVLYTISTAPFLGPARRGFRTFKRSCKLSLTMDQRRTYSSTLGKVMAGPLHVLRCGPFAASYTGWVGGTLYQYVMLHKTLPCFPPCS
jgi:hypothetical protein